MSRFEGEIQKFQVKLEAAGYELAVHGADNLWGSETTAAMNLLHGEHEYTTRSLPFAGTLAALQEEVGIDPVIDLSRLLGEIRAQQAAKSTKDEEGGGLPWWAWFLLVLGVGSLVGFVVWMAA